MARPEVWTQERLAAADLGPTAVWGHPQRTAALVSQLGATLVDALNDLPAGTETLVVVGGGTRIDQAKVWRVQKCPRLRLVAIPSLWGSGAEASPVAVLDRDGHKEVLLGEQYLPDIRCIVPELLDTVPASQARDACGDAWSHALEGFLSPLADDALRAELAQLIRSMLALPLARHPDWLEASARACAGQARSGVGLVHGIAHTLEAPLRAEQPAAGWGHARLCARFLYPVMCFDRQASDKLDHLMAAHGLDADAVLARVRPLYDDADYRAALPALERLWRQVLRDPCTRTNSTLVRPQSLAYFSERAFLA